MGYLPHLRGQGHDHQAEHDVTGCWRNGRRADFKPPYLLV